MKTQKNGHAATGAVTVDLTETQVASLKIEKVSQRAFAQERQAIGNIDFNQNRLVAVFAPYQGRIMSISANVGDPVEKDQALYTIDSPDLLTAESNLITAAGALVLQNRNLSRLKPLLKIGGASQQQVDQAISDQQAAEGALKSARDVLRIFGKTQEEIDKIIEDRIADSRFVVRSPLSGFVTARAAVPGQLVQPGVAPAPYVIADTSTMWMVANVVESDAPLLRLGQVVKARVAAYPGRDFDGRITVLGPSVDPITRRQAARIEIDDPDHLLRAGMFANFTIRIGEPIVALAAPQSAVVREGDGTMVCWVAKDRRRFVRRVVTAGLRQNGFVQILSGLQLGEPIVGEGAIFLSNQAAIGEAN
ncbi:efflux RND transporter periplasmic adaptor subunit [Methylocystis sp. B8]|uniref:efflux RND transporter periplasmic adaptor subunit n=1 Tax=Methylocystis sp. B8 TaxID=544938 RepID=UPI001FED3EC9|nr:efflux RND transporter periplasmic adaptor subunit [Methylocystis sp. B8]